MNDFNFARAGQMPAGTMDASVDVGLRKFMLGVFNKMGLGLAWTAILAFVVANTSLINMFFATNAAGDITGLSILYYIVAFGPIAILFGSAFVMKNPSPVGASVIYWSVVSLIGTGMGLLVWVYAGIPDGMATMAKAFLTTAIAFGGMSLWGYTTKRDLTPIGNFLMMAVFGLIAAMIINMFIASSMMSFFISIGGVLIFAGLTAFDTQRLKFQYYELGGNERAMSVATTYGALSLYINFINMFQFILALMSGGDD
ncbi:Bax inhibitor-1/YccA family protein [Ponticaulis koreensis]|uniref:Bax inhibitor-1/YccA family protein n=1 Tax=Ponticaulis koreensis TaxID=1123045 RepID=UPI0003B520E4|nr:Bax inhibitor-1/YccA family protein [Ponticaulis koreensis]